MCFFRKKPYDGMSVEDMLWWLEYDKEIHIDYLSKPESLITGDWAWHRLCISVFNDTINYIQSKTKDTPYTGKLTREQIIDSLETFQASHAYWSGHPSPEVGDAEWHYDWFIVYQEVIEYLKS